MSESLPRLRVAVVGAGYFAGFQLRAWARLPSVDLVAIANRTRAKAAAAAATHRIPHVFEDVEAMLDDVRPDLLDVVTPPETHAATIAAATARGIAVICQKPFCRSLAEARTVVAGAAAHGVPLFVHENFRFQPWHAESRRLVAAGAVGEPYQALVRVRPGDGQGVDAYRDRQPYFREMPRFLVRETALHFVDVLRALFGEVRAVQARLRRLNPAIRGEDAGLLLLEFEAGPWGLVDGNRLVDHATDDARRTLGEMLIEGSDGALRLDGGGRLYLRARGAVDERPHPFDWTDREFGGDCVFRLQAALVDHLREGTPMPNTAAAFLQNLVIEEALYRADAEARRVPVAAGGA